MSGPGSTSDSITGDYQAIVVANNTSGIASRVPESADSVVVTAITNDANDWIVLPPGRPGMSIRGWSVIAHEIRTDASTNVKINNVDSDGSQEAAIPATTLWQADYVSSTAGWILRAWDELAAPITAIVPD